MEKTFVYFAGDHAEVVTGEEALHLLKEKNDSKYFEDKIGIIKVDQNRWKEAQEYERKTWCVGPGKYCADDRNLSHQINFNNYRELPSLLKNDLDIIELGCGPYTNLRVIIPLLKKRIESIDLLDPLIKDYVLTSPNCSYRSGMLEINPVNLIKSSIEDFIPTKKYDLIVMINVLEHCFDIDLIFEKILNMMKENAIFLFADKVFRENYIKECVNNYYDEGHPILISEKYLEAKLKSFEVIYSKDLIQNEIRSYTDRYLILRKK